MSVISPKDANSLANSKRELPSQIFKFEEIDVDIGEFDIDDFDEEWNNSALDADLQLINGHRLSNSLNEASEINSSNEPDAYDFTVK